MFTILFQVTFFWVVEPKSAGNSGSTFIRKRSTKLSNEESLCILLTCLRLAVHHQHPFFMPSFVFDFILKHITWYVWFFIFNHVLPLQVTPLSLQSWRCLLVGAFWYNNPTNCSWPGQMKTFWFTKQRMFFFGRSVQLWPSLTVRIRNKRQNSLDLTGSDEEAG